MILHNEITLIIIIQISDHTNIIIIIIIRNDRLYFMINGIMVPKYANKIIFMT